MLKWICIIWSFSLLAPFADKALHLLSYQYDQRPFMAKCVNKQNPGSGCKGKCQLAKKIEAADKGQQESTNKNASYPDLIDDIARGFPDCAPPLRTHEASAPFLLWCIGSTNDYTPAHFRPPDPLVKIPGHHLRNKTHNTHNKYHVDT